ncbi:DNA translocase FtsK [Brucella sp. IR073]|uniref:DNA translocase FtsK n=1 Tax=unclassified Brucella TaxID=2632610 RepID=UPI003B987B47
MRIQRTNFPINSNDYDEENERREPIPPSVPSRTAAESINPSHAPTGYRGEAVRQTAPGVYQPLRPVQLQPITPRPVQPAASAMRPVPQQLAASGARSEHTNQSGYPPVWKHAFSMGENVRFTRTPQIELEKSKTPPTDPRANDLVRPKKDAPVKPQPAASVAVAAPAPAPQAVVAAPQPVAAAPIVKPAPVMAAAPASKEQAVSRHDTPFTHLSDFAFWESVDIFGELPAAPVAAPARPKPQATAITELFRVREWKQPGMADKVAEALAATMPVAVTPEPVAPVAEVAATPETVAAAQSKPEIEEAAAEVVQDNEPQAETVSAPEAAVEQEQAVEPAPIAAAPAPVSSTVVTMMPRREQSFTPARMELRLMGAQGQHGYELPPVELLQEPPAQEGEVITQEMLERKAGLLESVLEDFGVKGEIIHVRPGPVVTLYEFEPAPGIKSSRVIGLADDIARSMSALSARVAVVPGRNVIGIELPNANRETVYFREMITSEDFQDTDYKLALCLGKSIGGEPVVAELAKMPHLLVAGTTGSGKSVAINTMILSLLYRMTPEQCRLIMVDPKMLELSIYDGIPHLLTPVVTDPKKAVMALKWAVREMEDRYRKMSAVGVRNIDGFNARVAAAKEKGEAIVRTVQTGFDKNTGETLYEQEEMDLSPMPYIVIIVDEMADLMMVAGKEIEGAIQRLAQMARAAGIHLIMATQRPSVDVITGTIKANFPTRISFQVTSKIDSRTILGEMGAEQLLGQGDMLHMVGGGRISRVHGPFVSDEEVEKVVSHLKLQGRPDYLNTVTADEEEETPEPEDTAVFDKTAMAEEDGDDDLYAQAVKVIMRDKKCSTSYIQRRLGIGYNRAASLVERMEKEGLVGPANHVGKREILSQ